MSSISFRQDVTITKVEGKGFLLQRDGDQNFAKLGLAFKHLIPMLIEGCDRKDLISFFLSTGCKENKAESKVNQILISLEELGLLIGSSYSVRSAQTGDIHYETSIFGNLIESISALIPSMNIRINSLVVFTLSMFSISILALWAMVFRPRPQSLEGANILLLVIAVLTWFFLHEISHAVVARKCNVGVRAIGIKFANSSRLSIFPYCHLEEKDVVFDARKHALILLAGPTFDLCVLGILSFIYLVYSPDVILPQLIIVGAAMTILSTSIIFPSDIRHALALSTGSLITRRKTATIQAMLMTLNSLLALFLVLAIVMLIGNSIVSIS